MTHQHCPLDQCTYQHLPQAQRQVAEHLYETWRTSIPAELHDRHIRCHLDHHARYFRMAIDLCPRCTDILPEYARPSRAHAYAHVCTSCYLREEWESQHTDGITPIEAWPITLTPIRP